MHSLTGKKEKKVGVRRGRTDQKEGCWKSSSQASMQDKQSGRQSGRQPKQCKVFQHTGRACKACPHACVILPAFLLARAAMNGLKSVVFFFFFVYVAILFIFFFICCLVSFLLSDAESFGESFGSLSLRPE